MIYATFETVALTCGADAHDRQFFAALQSGVDRIEQFMFRNSDITPQQLEDYLDRSVRRMPDLCEADSSTLKLYEDVRQRFSPAWLASSLDTLLEVERPVLWNPCL